MEEDEIIIGVKRPNKKSSKNNSKKKIKSKAKKSNSKDNVKKTKRLKILRIISLIAICIFLIILLLSSSLFNVTTILVEGNSHLSDEKVISLSSIELYTNMFNFSKVKIKSKLRENPYIENVKVSRRLPSTIVLTIEERVPTYMLQFADSYVYIDKQGYMLEISNEKVELPILTGFTTDLSNIKAGNRINSDDLNKMRVLLKIHQALENNGLAEKLSKIDTSDEKNYTLFLDSEGKKVYLGNATDLSTKIVCLKSILEVSSGKTGEIFLNIDLNTERPYFRETIQ